MSLCLLLHGLILVSYIFHTSLSFFIVTHPPKFSNLIDYIKRNNKLLLFAKIKKKTNSKRSFSIDTDPDEDVDDSLIVIKNQEEGVDIEASIIQARNNLNSLKVNLNPIKTSPDNEENQTVRIESSVWKETVQNLIKDVVSTRLLKLSLPSSSTTISDDMTSDSMGTSEPDVGTHLNESSSISPVSISSLPSSSTSSSSSSQNNNQSKLIKLSIIAGRIEVIVSNGACDDGDLQEFDAEVLRNIHREIYDALELYDVNNPTSALDVVARYEVR